MLGSVLDYISRTNLFNFVIFLSILIFLFKKIDVVGMLENMKNAVIENIEIAEGDVLIVGIYVKCGGSGNGAWGKIDDALLNSITK